MQSTCDLHHVRSLAWYSGDRNHITAIGTGTWCFYSNCCTVDGPGIVFVFVVVNDGSVDVIDR